MDLDFRSGYRQEKKKKGTRGARHNKHIFSVCWCGWQEEEEETKEPLCRFKSTASPRDGEEKRIVKWAFPQRRDEMCLRACSLLYRYWFDVLSPVNIEVLICLFVAACHNRMQVVIYKRGKTVCAYRVFLFWRAREECFSELLFFFLLWCQPRSPSNCHCKVGFTLRDRRSSDVSCKWTMYSLIVEDCFCSDQQKN